MKSLGMGKSMKKGGGNSGGSDDHMANKERISEVVKDAIMAD